MNATHVTVTGNLVADPSSRQTPNGIPVTSFRIASTDRRRDNAGAWVDGHTSYYQVTCWRAMGERATACLRKGDAVVVHGRVQVKEWDDRDGIRRSFVDIEAYAFGPDLARVAATVARAFPEPVPVPTDDAETVAELPAA